MRLRGIHALKLSRSVIVLPNSNLETAKNQLSKHSGLLLCLEDESCPAYPIVRCHPQPAYHFHINSSKVSLDIFPTVSGALFLTALESSLLLSPAEAILPPQYLLSSYTACLPPRDRPSRGSGVFASPKNAVVVFNANFLLEAYMSLSSQDSRGKIGSYSLAMADYMELYVDEDGFIDGDQLELWLHRFTKQYIELNWSQQVLVYQTPPRSSQKQTYQPQPDPAPTRHPRRALGCQSTRAAPPGQSPAPPRHRSPPT